MKLNIPVLLALLAFAPSAFAQVKVEETTAKIPTYLVDNPEKDPYFFTGRTYQGAAGHIYPYPIYDILTDERVEREYKWLSLGNEYTTIGVLPEIGGRIFSASDNQTGYNFFYRQHVVRPALIGMIGSWISGGVEWNIPHHHRASSTLNAGYEITENPDGSKTIWIGETELRQRLMWTIGLTIFPGKSYVKATFRIENRTPMMESFLYWANVSVHANKNYQVQFPPETQFGTSHSKTRYIDWPFGPLEGRSEPEDNSWWANYRSGNSTFAVNYMQDFLVGYDFGADAGTAYWANHHLSPGKKFFLWGTESVWNQMLTEEDGAYLELMTGSFSDNQPDYSWIGPNEIREVDQYWYPIKGIGGAKFVNLEGAVNVVRKDPTTMFVGFNSTCKRPDARIIVTAGGKTLMDKRVSIDPDSPFKQEFTVDKDLADSDFRAALCDAAGNELVAYSPVVLPEIEKPHPADRPGTPEEYTSSEELVLAGQRLEEFHNARLSPLPFYEEALKRDSLDSRANVNMGIYYARHFEWEKAEKYLQRAYKRLTGLHYMPEIEKTGIMYQTNPKDGEMLYYLGVVSQALGKCKEAEEYYWKSTWYPGFGAAAHMYLAEMYWKQGRKAEAMKAIDNSLSLGGKSTLARFVKAWFLQDAGDKAGAKALLKGNLEMDPVDFLSQVEIARLEGKKYKDILAHMGNPLQESIEVATYYGSVGAYASAAEFLEAVIAEGWPYASTPMQKNAVEPFISSPLLNYMAGYYLGLAGDDEAALSHYRIAATMSPDYCFPFRTEEQAMLQDVIARNPSDSKAKYYLGNLLYYKEQKDAAIACWKASAEQNPAYGMPLRNLGFATDKYLGDRKSAAEYYRKAVAADPSDPKFFNELDVLEEALGTPSKDRLALMQKNRKTIFKSDDATTRYVSLLVESGKYDEALNIMKDRHFRVWEGGATVYTHFVDAHLLNGLKFMGKKQYKKALEDFLAAGTFPKNLETNELSTGPTVAKVAFHQGLAYKALGQQDKAAEAFRRCIETAKGGNRWERIAGDETGYYVAMSHRALGDEAAADAAIKTMEESAQKLLSSASNTVVDIYSKFGEDGTSNAIKARANYIAGLAALARGNKAEAKKDFDASLKLNPSSNWAKYYLGTVK